MINKLSVVILCISKIPQFFQGWGKSRDKKKNTIPGNKIEEYKCAFSHYASTNFVIYMSFVCTVWNINFCWFMTIKLNDVGDKCIQNAFRIVKLQFPISKNLFLKDKKKMFLFFSIAINDKVSLMSGEQSFN